MSKALLAKAISELMPSIIRGVHLDFFTKRPITQTQFLMLLAVQGHGCCSMGTLAKQLHISLPTASGIADRLVRSELIHRETSKEDRRSVYLSVTAKGEQYIQGFKSVIQKRWKTVLRVLEEKDIAHFYKIVLKLIDHLKEKE